MTLQSVFLSYWIVAACPSLAVPRPDENGLVDFENTRARYSRESGDLKKDYEGKLKELRGKYRQSAERGKAAATKKGDLQLALAWEKFEKELQPEGSGGPGQDAAASLPKEVEKARSDFGRDVYDVDGELKRKLRDLRDKYRKTAEERTAVETKQEDLKLASAWEEFRKELEPALANLARKAKVTVDAAMNEHPKENLTDGVTNVNPKANQYWSAGKDAKRHWAQFDLGGSRLIRKVRILAPVATRWVRGGYEPLDYELIFKLGGKVKERVTVRDGKHPRKQLFGRGTQWIEIEPKSGIEASEVEFACTKTSGKNLPPVLFEFEILGEE
jgi:hypothetical protein